MVVELTTATIPLVVVGVLGTGLAALTLLNRGQKGVYPLAGVFAGAALWAGAYALEFSSTQGDPVVVWLRLRFLGSTIVPVAIFLLALQVTDRGEVVTPRNVLSLFVVPALTNAIIWLNPADLWVTGYAGPPPLSASWGPWFYVYVLYQFVLALGAVLLFAERALDRQASVVNTATMLLVATILPVVGTAFYVTGLSPVDYGAYAFLVSGVLMLAAMFYL